MNKFFLSICAIFLMTNLFAQEGEWLANYCEGSNYQTLEKKLDSLMADTSDSVKYIWKIRLKREIVDDFFEQVIEFEKRMYTPDKSYTYSFNKYRVKLIRKNQGEICYYQIAKLKYNNPKNKKDAIETIKKKDSTALLNRLKSSFVQVYQVKLNFEELFRNDIMYGHLCGTAGNRLPYSFKVHQLIEKRDTTTLFKWLRSATIEVQLFAIYGIWCLKKEKMKFDRSVFQLIDQIADKAGFARVCIGGYVNEPIKLIIKELKNG